MPVRFLMPFRRLLIALCAFAIIAAPATASPDAVILDYGDNGQVDGEHSLPDLRAALDIWQDNPQYGAFADEVTAALDRHLLGVAATAPPPDPPPPMVQTPPPSLGSLSAARTDDPPPPPGALGDLEGPIVSAPALDAIPSPPVATADAGAPTALLILAAAALLLLVAGLASTAHRRLRS